MKNILTLIIAVLLTSQVFGQNVQEFRNDLNNKRTIVSKPGDYAGSTITSKQNGNWGLTSTWNGGIVPTSSDNVIINHNVTLTNNDYGCNELTINSGKKLTINSTWWLYCFGNVISNGTIQLNDGTSSFSTMLMFYKNFTNNGTLTSTGGYTRIDFYGTSAQTFTNDGTITNQIYSLGLSNTSGLTLSVNKTFPIVRLNLFAGAITNSNKIVLGNGTFALIQRGVLDATDPAGSLTSAPVMNGSSSLYLRYDESTTLTTTGFEIPASNTVYTIFSNNNNNTLLAKSISITNKLEFNQGKFQIGANTLTSSNSSLYINGGQLEGGSTSNLVLNGDTSVIELPALTLNTLTLNKSNGITLKGNLVITNLLTLTNGVLNTTNKNITFTTTALNPVETSTKRIDGTAVMDARTIGTGSFNFLGAYFAAATQSLGSVNITRRTGSIAIGQGNSNQSIACNWDIDAQNQPTSGRNMTYNWFSVYDNGNFFGDNNRGQVYYSIDAGANWSSIGGLVNPVTGTSTRALTINTTHYSRWSVGSENSPLPVKLNSFVSSVSGNNVKLNWATTSEENNSGFEVYRSELSKNEFVKVGFVTGKGNSNTVTNYTYEDKKLNSGKYEYKLKQVDYNGNYEFFTLNNSVEVGNPGKFTLSQNYPNPFNPVTKIDFSLPMNSKVNIVVYDITGKVISTLVNETKSAGFHTVEFNASNLSSGVYFYMMTTESFKDIKKLTVIK
jgi:hypothetical protein